MATLISPPADRVPAEILTSTGASPIGIWFVRCLVVGGVLALFSLSEAPALHTIGILGPIGATLAYPLVGGRLGFQRSPSQRERFADNCYYLGFIFTQIALLVGFAPVMLFNRTIGSQDVLRAFSMALGAALVGLVARTYFIQTGHSLSENSQRIEDEVEALATSVSRQAGRVLGEFDKLGSRLTQTYEQLNDELATCVGSLVRTVNNFEVALNRDLRAVEAGGAAVTDATAESVAAVQKQQVHFVNSLQEAVHGIEAVRVSASEQLGSARQALEASTLALAQGASALSGASGFSDRLSAFEARAAGAAEAAERVQGELARTAERIAASGAEAATTVAAAGRDLSASTVQRAQDFERELSQAVEALERTLVSFRSELERVRG